MRHQLVSACGALALLASSVHAAAQTPAPAAPAPAPTMQVPAPPLPGPAPDVRTGSPGSTHLRCDGKPVAQTGAVVAGQLLLIMATAGLSGGGETADVSKRLEGQAGVDACDAAFTSEPDPIRKVELRLARAVHEIELKNYDTALEDIDRADGAAGGKAAERGYQASLKLSQMELKAAIMVRKNRPAEAEKLGLEMFQVAPYDMLNLYRAIAYVGLTDQQSPAKQAFYDTLGRMSAEGMLLRIASKEWAGDYAGAAADCETLLAMLDGYAIDKTKVRPPIFLAHAAVDYALAGDMAKSNAFAAEARTKAEEAIAGGKESTVASAEEVLDFQAIARQLAEGKATEARAAFAARSRWLAPGAPAVATLTGKLRTGAPAAELTGALARDPAALRADALAARAAALVNDPNANKGLFRAIRPYIRANDYASLARNVWKTDKSKYLIKRKDKVQLNGELVNVAPAGGSAAGEAVLLHTALLAKSRGKAGFTVTPTRNRVDYGLVLIGNPGDPGVPAGAMFDADTVIKALSPDLPQPTTP